MFHINTSYRRIVVLFFAYFFSISAFSQFKIYNWVRYHNAPSNMMPYLQPIGLSLQTLTDSKNAPDYTAIKSFASSTLPYDVTTLDIETWSYAKDSLTTSINRYNSSVDSFKSINPTSKVGYYGAIPQQKYEWNNLNTTAKYNSWMIVNDSLKRAAAKVDVFFPSAYCRDSTTDYWKSYIDSNVSVIKRLYSSTKPIYIYICPQYIIGSTGTGAVDRQFIDPIRWKKLLEYVYNSADGAVVWTSNLDSLGNRIDWNNKMSWWTATKEFLLSKSLVSPFRIDTFYTRFTDNGINVHWETSIDTIANYFVVEKSTDGINFNTISGNISSLRQNCLHSDYDYLDGVSSGNQAYYRLKIVNIDNSISYSDTIVYTPSVHYKSVGSGVVADLGSAQNWLVNDGTGWETATVAPGITGSGIGSGGSIVISPSDIWANNISKTQLGAGVTLIDSSSATLGTFSTTNTITTIAGSSIVFCAKTGTQYMPSFAYFEGKTVNSDITIDNSNGVMTSSPSSGAVSGTVTGTLILNSGVFTTNNGGGTFNYSGAEIQTNGGYIYVNGYFAITGNRNFSIPMGVFSSASGSITNAVTHLNIGTSGYMVTTEGNLIINNRLNLNSGYLSLGGNLTLNAATSANPLSVGTGGLIDNGDTVIFNNSATQIVPANFFLNNTVSNLEIKQTNSLNVSSSITITNAIIIDKLNAVGTIPVAVTGTATVNASVVVQSFSTPPTVGSTYTILTSTTLQGDYNVNPVLPSGYAGVVTKSGNNLILTITSNTVLPLTLLKFSASQVGSSSRLEWSVSAVKDVNYFLIQRSMDGSSFSTIDTSFIVDETQRNYQYNDNYTSIGKVYYRLQYVDMDGNYSNSNVVFLDKSLQKISFSLSPNPTSDYLYLRQNVNYDGINSAMVYDVEGRLLMSTIFNSDAGNVSLNVRALAKGVYFVVIKNKDSIVYKNQFIKK